jgi:hypothetical protein
MPHCYFATGANKEAGRYGDGPSLPKTAARQATIVATFLHFNFTFVILLFFKLLLLNDFVATVR